MNPGPADFARWLIALLKDELFNLWRPIGPQPTPPPDRPPAPPIPTYDQDFTSIDQVVAAAKYWHPQRAALIEALASHTLRVPWNVSGGAMP